MSRTNATIEGIKVRLQKRSAVVSARRNVIECLIDKLRGIETERRKGNVSQTEVVIRIVKENARKRSQQLPSAEAEGKKSFILILSPILLSWNWIDSKGGVVLVVEAEAFHAHHRHSGRKATLVWSKFFFFLPIRTCFQDNFLKTRARTQSESPVPETKREGKKDRRKEVERDQSPQEKVLKKRKPSPSPIKKVKGFIHPNFYVYFICI